MYDNETNVNVKYCVTNTNKNNSNTKNGGNNNANVNQLCDKCNLNQQRKVEELAKFEPKNEVISKK